jgi:DNA repair protein RAD5
MDFGSVVQDEVIISKLAKTEYTSMYRDEWLSGALCYTTVLKPYQKAFVAWGLERESTVVYGCRGGFLLDEPGLGKTLQILSLIAASKKRPNRTLIICPSHLMHHWETEIKTHFKKGTFRTLRYFGKGRHDIRRKEIESMDIVFSSYMCMAKDIMGRKGVFSDGFHLVESTFNRLVLDESQTIRNNSNTSDQILKLYFRSTWCITATPFMNRINDLYNQVCMLGIVPYCDRLEWYRKISSVANWSPDVALERILSHVIIPFSIRREKLKVEELPERHEEIVWLEFSEIEREFYDSMLKVTQQRVEGMLQNLKIMKQNYARFYEYERKIKMKAIVFITKLRQMCAHPKIILNKIMGESGTNGVSKSDMLLAIRILNDKIKNGLSDECSICLSEAATFGNGLCSHLVCRDCADEFIKKEMYKCPICRMVCMEWNEVTGIIDVMSLSVDRNSMDDVQFPSVKLEYVMNAVKSSTGKVVVISQWIEVLSLYRKAFEEAGIHCIELSGKTSPQRRPKLVDKFMTDSSIRVCLLSLCASSEGISLTAADTAYHIDPWWNENKGLQASDRIHRIGQTSNVKIVHLRMKDSIETSITVLQRKKTQVFNTITGKRKSGEEAPWMRNISLLLGPREQAALSHA